MLANLYRDDPKPLPSPHEEAILPVARLVRDEWMHTVYRGPADTDNLTQETYEKRDEYRSLMLKEPAVSAAFWSRIASVMNLLPKVHAQDPDNPAEVEVANFVKDAIGAVEGGWPRVIGSFAAGGLLDGFSVCELVYDFPERGKWRNKRWVLKEIAPLDGRFIRFDIDAFKRVVGVRGLKANAGQVFGVDRFAIYSHQQLFNNPFGISQFRAAYRAAKMMESAIKLRIILLQNFTGPFVAFKSASPETRASAMRIVANARSQGFLVCDKNDDFTVTNMASGSDSEFQSAMDDLRKEMYTAICWGYLPFVEGREGAELGNSTVQKSITELGTWRLATGIAEVINRDIVRPLVRANIADETINFPFVSLGGQNTGDKKAAGDVFEQAKRIGVTLSKKQIQRAMDLEEPNGPEDELKEMPTGGMAGADNPFSGMPMGDGGMPPDAGAPPTDGSPVPDGGAPMPEGDDAAPGQPGQPQAVKAGGAVDLSRWNPRIGKTDTAEMDKAAMIAILDLQARAHRAGSPGRFQKAIDALRSMIGNHPAMHVALAGPPDQAFGWRPEPTRTGGIKAINTENPKYILYGEKAKLALNDHPDHPKVAQESHERYQGVLNAKSKAQSLAAKMGSTGTGTSAEYKELAGHVQHLTVDEIYGVRKALVGSFSNAHKRAEMVSALSTYALRKAGEAVPDALPGQPSFKAPKKTMTPGATGGTPPSAPPSAPPTPTANAGSSGRATNILKDHLDASTGLTPAQWDHYHGAIDKATAKMPAAAHARIEQNLSGATFHAKSASIGDALYQDVAEQSPDPSKFADLKGQKIGVGYCTSKGTLHINGDLRPGAGEDRNPEQFGVGKYAPAHEVYAHALGRVIDGPNYEMSSSKEWQQAFTDEIAHSGHEWDTHKLSRFASMSPEQGFAEFSRLVYGSKVSPKDVSREFPKATAFFRKQGLLPTAETIPNSGMGAAPKLATVPADAVHPPVRTAPALSEAFDKKVVVAQDGSHVDTLKPLTEEKPKPVEKKSPFGRDELKGKPPVRNFMVGTGNIATMQFDSNMQQRLYNLGSKQRQSMRGKEVKGGGPGMSAEIAMLAAATGRKPGEIRNLSSDVYDDVRKQMKGAKDQEHRVIVDNHNVHGNPAPVPVVRGVNEAKPTQAADDAPAKVLDARTDPAPGEAIPPAPGAGKPSTALDLNDHKALASAVHDAASQVPDMFGKDANGPRGDWDGHKVLIGDTFDQMKKSGKLPESATLDQFKDSLTKAHAGGAVQLSRLDMPQIFDQRGGQERWKPSEIQHPAGGMFHAINVPGSKISPRAELAPSLAETPHAKNDLLDAAMAKPGAAPSAAPAKDLLAEELAKPAEAPKATAPDLNDEVFGKANEAAKEPHEMTKSEHLKQATTGTAATSSGSRHKLPGYPGEFELTGQREVLRTANGKKEYPVVMQHVPGMSKPTKVKDLNTLEKLKGIESGDVDAGGYKPGPNDPYQIKYRGTAGGMTGMNQPYVVHGENGREDRAYVKQDDALERAKHLNEQHHNLAHRSAVSAALAAGKAVPPHVLADYPDLAAKGTAAPDAKPTPPDFAPGTKEDAASVLDRVKASPNQPADRDWDAHAQRHGIEGNFTHVEIPTKTLTDNVFSGHLRRSNSVDQNAVDKKVESGDRNPVLITKEPGRGSLVVDGNHSLAAAMQAGDPTVQAIVSEKSAFHPKGEEPAPAEPKTRHEQNGWTPENHVKIAADSIDKLRGSHVDRLLDSAPPGLLDKMADHIRTNRPDLKDTVDAVHTDILRERKQATGKANDDQQRMEQNAKDADAIPRVSNEDFANGSWDQAHAGLSSEAVALKMALGMKGIEGREYGIRQHSPGKWQMVSKPMGAGATDSGADSTYTPPVGDRLFDLGEAKRLEPHHAAINSTLESAGWRFGDAVSPKGKLEDAHDELKSLDDHLSEKADSATAPHQGAHQPFGSLLDSHKEVLADIAKGEHDLGDYGTTEDRTGDAVSAFKDGIDRDGLHQITNGLATNGHLEDAQWASRHHDKLEGVLTKSIEQAVKARHAKAAAETATPDEHGVSLTPKQREEVEKNGAHKAETDTGDETYVVHPAHLDKATKLAASIRTSIPAEKQRAEQLRPRTEARKRADSKWQQMERQAGSIDEQIAKHRGESEPEAVAETPKASAGKTRNTTEQYYGRKDFTPKRPQADEPKAETPAPAVAAAPAPATEAASSPKSDVSLADKLKERTAGIDMDHVRNVGESHKAKAEWHDKRFRALGEAMQKALENKRAAGSRQPESKNATKEINKIQKEADKAVQERGDHSNSRDVYTNRLQSLAIDPNQPDFVRLAAASHDFVAVGGNNAAEEITPAVREHLTANGHDPEMAAAVAQEIVRSPMRGANQLDGIIQEEKTRAGHVKARAEAREHIRSLGLPDADTQNAMNDAQAMYSDRLDDFKKKWSGVADGRKAETERQASAKAESEKRMEAGKKADAEGEAYIASVKSGHPDTNASPDAVQRAIRHVAEQAHEWHEDVQLPAGKGAKQAVDEIIKNPSKRFGLGKTIVEKGWVSDTKYMMKATPEMVAHAKSQGVEKDEARSLPVESVLPKSISDYTDAKLAASRVHPSEGLGRVLMQAGDRHMEFDPKYIANVLKHYPDAQWKMGKTTAVAVQNGEVVGLVMPFSASDGDDKKPRQIATGKRLAISDVAEPGPFKAEDVKEIAGKLKVGEGTDMAAELTIVGNRDGQVYLKGAGTDDRMYGSAREAVAAGKEILAHSHGTDEDGNIVFKPKGAGTTELTGEAKTKRDYYAGLREKAKGKPVKKSTEEVEGLDGSKYSRELHHVSDSFHIAKDIKDKDGKESGYVVVHTASNQAFPGKYDKKADAIALGHAATNVPGHDWTKKFDDMPDKDAALAKLKNTMNAFDEDAYHPDMGTFGKGDDAPGASPAIREPQDKPTPGGAEVAKPAATEPAKFAPSPGDTVTHTGRAGTENAEFRGYHSSAETGEKMARVIFRPESGPPYEMSVPAKEISGGAAASAPTEPAKAALAKNESDKGAAWEPGSVLDVNGAKFMHSRTDADGTVYVRNQNGDEFDLSAKEATAAKLVSGPPKDKADDQTHTVTKESFVKGQTGKGLIAAKDRLAGIRAQLPQALKDAGVKLPFGISPEQYLAVHVGETKRPNKVLAALHRSLEGAKSGVTSAENEHANTRPDVGTKRFTLEGIHRRMVESAIVAGKPVPAEVLKDYPDLGQKNWRRQHDAETDPYRKHQLLRMVADAGRAATDADLSEVLGLVNKDGGDRGNIAWAVAKNPMASPETKAKALALREEWMDGPVEPAADVKHASIRDAITKLGGPDELTTDNVDGIRKQLYSEYPGGTLTHDKIREVANEMKQSGGAPATTEAPALHAFAQQQFDDHRPILEQHVASETAPRRQWGKADSVLHGLNPDAQKALLEHLATVAPEAYEHGRANPPMHLVNVMKGMGAAKGGEGAKEPHEMTATELESYKESNPTFAEKYDKKYGGNFVLAYSQFIQDAVKAGKSVPVGVRKAAGAKVESWELTQAERLEDSRQVTFGGGVRQFGGESSDRARKQLDDRQRQDVIGGHRAAVESALNTGKPVPAEVLKDYPDLAAKYAKGNPPPDDLGGASPALKEPTPKPGDTGAGAGKEVPLAKKADAIVKAGIESKEQMEPRNAEPQKATDERSDSPFNGANRDGSGLGADAGREPRPASAGPRILTARPEHTKAGNTDLLSESVKANLSPDQAHGAALAVEAMTKNGGFLNNDGTGVGKTRQQLAVAKTFADQGKKVVIISPKQVTKADFKKGTLSGSFANDSQVMGVPLKLTKGDDPLSPGQVHISTYENVSKLKDKIDGNTVVIWDESHYMKNPTSARAKHGQDIDDKAHSVMYASATPGDKALHISHLRRAGVFGAAGKTKTLEKLGMELHDQHVGGGQYRKVWRVKPGTTHEEVARRMSGLFDQMTKDGLMIKRELSLDGAKFNTDRIQLSPEQHKEMNDVYNNVLENTDGNRAIALMAARMHQEHMKIPHMVEQVKRDLVAGRQPIIFAGRVNSVGDEDDHEDHHDNEVKDALKRTGHSSAGTIPAMKAALIAAGVPEDLIAELHGEAKEKPEKAMQRFQDGKAKVMLATIQSGGTGVNLDDTVGNAPRSVHVMTPPLTANDMAQAIGRAHRLNTKSNTNIHAVLADTAIDDWNAGILHDKFQSLGAISGGQITRGAEALGNIQPPKQEDHKPFDWGQSLIDTRHYHDTPAYHNELIKSFGGERIRKGGDFITQFPSKEHFERYKEAAEKRDAEHRAKTQSSESAAQAKGPQHHSGKSHSFTQLKNGNWGTQIVGDANEGDTAVLTKRDGGQKQVKLGKVVWRGNGVSLAEIS